MAKWNLANGPRRRPLRISIKQALAIIQLFANCPKCNGSVGSFYTWTGIQEKGQSYLKVTDFEQHSDAYIITLQFACKLYDNHGRYYADVKNGEMRLKYTF